MEALADTSLLFPCSEGNPASARMALLIACSEAKGAVTITGAQEPSGSTSRRARWGGTGLLITDGPGVDFLVQEIPRKRSREFLSSIPKQALEAGRRQLGVTHRMRLEGSPISATNQFSSLREAFWLRSCRPIRNQLRGNAHESRRIFFSGYLHRRTPRPRQDLLDRSRWKLCAGCCLVSHPSIAPIASDEGQRPQQLR